MKLDGSAVQYLLSREFDDVVGEGLPRKALFDYPMLYDVSADMSGHVVLVPVHERPLADVTMGGTLCVCVGEESAQSARQAGAAVILIHGEVTFQHLYNRMQRIFVENERLDAQLRALVDTYAGFQPLIEACVRTWGYPCALIDEHFRVVCGSFAEEQADSRELHDAWTADILEPDIVDLFMASREYRYMRVSHTVFTMPSSGNMMMKNVFSKGLLVGSLVMEHKGDALSARFVRFLLRYLGSYVEEAYSRIGSFGVSSIGMGRVKVALQNAVEGNAADRANLESVLAEGGHLPGCEYVVLCFERSFTNESDDERDYLTRRLELTWPFAYCFAFEGGLFMLVDVSENAQGAGKDFSKKLPFVARENLSKVGVSRPFCEMDHLDAALLQARIALKRGSEVDPMNWCYRFKDYAFSWLISRLIEDMPPDYVCHPAVTILANYDARHGTDLLTTLSMFIKHRYNATTASQELFVARSTLLNRLSRIEELTKINLDDSVDRTYLALSLVMSARLQ